MSSESFLKNAEPWPYLKLVGSEPAFPQDPLCTGKGGLGHAFKFCLHQDSSCCRDTP